MVACRHPNNPIFTAKDWPYAANSVFNPTATMFDDKVLLLIRVEDRRGFSLLTKAVSDDGLKHWILDCTPTLKPDPINFPEKIWGIEDPRITWMETLGQYAITYTAFSPSGPMVALALTKDFDTFERMGPIMPPEDKDAALFPKQFDGRYALIHRPVSTYTGYAHIWISFSKDLKYWGNHHILLHARPSGWWDGNKIGLNALPLETPEGWLLVPTVSG